MILSFHLQGGDGPELMGAHLPFQLTDWHCHSLFSWQVCVASTSPAGPPYRPLCLLGPTLLPVASRRFTGTFMDRLAAFPSSFTVPHEHTSVSGINCARECGFSSAFSSLLSNTNLFRQPEQDERYSCACRIREDQSPPPQGFLALVQSSDTSTQASVPRG